MKTSFRGVFSKMSQLFSSKTRGQLVRIRARRSQFLLRGEQLEDRRLLATYYVDDPTGYMITSNQGGAGLDNGDTVTWNPDPGSAHPGTPVSGLTFGTNAFTSIQAAVDAANAGDTVRVGSGTFAETVDINEQLFVLGNQVDVDAQSGRTGAAETIVTGVGASPAGGSPFNITASDVELNGFTIQGATDPNSFGFGILLGAGTSGSEIRNNIVELNIAGLSLANSSASNQTVIEQNLFRNNNQPGPVSGTGIYTDQSNAGGALTNVLIDNNTFTTNDNVAVLIGPTSATAGASNITISRNVMTGNGNAILLFNTTNSAVTDNEIRNSAFSQFVIGGGVNGLTVTGNFIEDGATRGIRIGEFGGGGTNQNISINFNSIAGNPTAGLELDAGGYTGTLDAENNYWGSPTGPTHPDNPGGTGDIIVDPNDQVDYVPFLTSGEGDDPSVRGFDPVVEEDELTCEVTTLNLPGEEGTATLEDDADNPGESVIIVTGTSGNDVIVVDRNPRNRSQLRVQRNGRTVDTFNSSDAQRVVVFGLEGNDTIIVNASLSISATLFGDDGNDKLYAARGDDELSGGDGNDRLFGGAGNDTLCGDEGNDFLYGQAGNDTVGGDAGNDHLFGEAGNDLLLGNEGNDSAFGGSGDDELFGQEGNDRLFGDAGNDVIVGGDDNDQLYGGSGRDILIGGEGADTLYGGTDDDILIAGSTAHDNDREALQSILSEWTSRRRYADRVSNVQNGGGNNGAFVFDEATVTDDEATDTLFGQSGQDWFLAGDNDRIRDRARNEQVN